jgi:hypothetical protein
VQQLSIGQLLQCCYSNAEVHAAVPFFNTAANGSSCSFLLQKKTGYPAVRCTAANQFEYDKFGTAERTAGFSKYLNTAVQRTAAPCTA